MQQPILNTNRLVLRPFSLDDAKRVQELAGDKKIADTTLHVPHPYPDGAAEAWISTHKENAENRKMFTFAITLKETKELVGAIGITVNKIFNNAEAGYWIGVPFWNMGYATEALGALIEFAFLELKLNKFCAHHIADNKVSGKVMIKNGMQKEGHFKKHFLKNEIYHDAIFYGILREDYLADK